MSESTQWIQKACACLVDARGRLLVFDHPADGDAQLPKGTVETGEASRDAARRELLEESGVDFTGSIEDLGTMERHCDAGIEGNLHAHLQIWHLYLMRSVESLPECFEHVAWGSSEEDGLVFRFRWLSHDEALDGFSTPYLCVIERVRAALRERSD